MDAELHQKREKQRDPEFELEVAKWIQNAIGEPLADLNDLWVSLRSGKLSVYFPLVLWFFPLSFFS
jgi:hypothetical protein